MEHYVFRANDIRGKVGVDFAIDDMGRLVGALQAYCTHKGLPLSRVVLARDGRTHSPAIHAVMTEALLAHGVEICEVGVVPTPVMHFMVNTLTVDGGIMITASHNGPDYNGCKIVLRRDPLHGEDLQELASHYANQSSVPCRGSGRGVVVDYTMSAEQYSAWLVLQFPHLVGYQRPLVFDCGNGVTGQIMPALVEAMEWSNVTLLYADIDGQFPHHDADPTVRENMEECMRTVMVQEASCGSASKGQALGIGFDGDGDRMGVVTSRGRLISGDVVIALFAQALLHDYPGARIVYDIKSSSVVSNSIHDAGGFAYMAPSGHAIIRDYMDRYKAIFGGELSGHFFFADRYFGYDDGIYAALRLLELVQRSSATLDELIDRLPTMYATREWRIPYAECEKFNLLERIKGAVDAYPGMRSINLLDGIRVATSDGWWLMRASNTQPAVCLRAESDTKEGIKRIVAMVQSVCRADHQLWGVMEHDFQRWGSSV